MARSFHKTLRPERPSLLRKAVKVELIAIAGEMFYGQSTGAWEGMDTRSIFLFGLRTENGLFHGTPQLNSEFPLPFLE